jgi:hypothetical protein
MEKFNNTWKRYPQNFYLVSKSGSLDSLAIFGVNQYDMGMQTLRLYEHLYRIK